MRGKKQGQQEQDRKFTRVLTAKGAERREITCKVIQREIVALLEKRNAK